MERSKLGEGRMSWVQVRSSWDYKEYYKELACFSNLHRKQRMVYSAEAIIYFPSVNDL